MSAARDTAVRVREVDARKIWEQAFEAAKKREFDFSTLSGSTVAPIYGPADADVDFERDLGWPGQFPFTRGVHPTMYRDHL